MATNNRIFYACQAVIIMKRGHTPHVDGLVKGLQSVGMSSTFTLEQVFEIGQLAIYENIEDIADIEVTLEKLIDGHNLIYALASDGACRTDIVTASKNRCDVYLGIFDDGVSNATGVPRNVCWNSGMYISSVSYNYSVDGNATESVTLVGNDRYWNAIKEASGGPGTATSKWSADLTAAVFDGTHSAASGVIRRVDVDIANSTIPEEVRGQHNPDDEVAKADGLRIQSVSVSADFGQEQILELGRFGPYTRYASFPIEVSCEFEVMAASGDLVTVSGNGTNLSNREIVLKDDAGTVLNLATKNKLSSVSYTGGDTGGGNATVSYSYSNFNDLTVQGGSGIDNNN